MKPTLTIRSAAFFMAFLLILTSTGFSMNMHFCGGEFQGVALFGSEVECNMMQEMKAKPACPMHESASMSSMSCCEDQHVQIESGSHETILLKNIQQSASWAFLPAPAFSEIISPAVQEIHQSYTTYRPPPTDRDIFVLVQSFLL